MASAGESLGSVRARIRKGNVPPILVTRFEADAGEDLHGRDLLVREVRRALLGESPEIFGQTIFDAPSVTLVEVLDAAREISLLCPKRLVLVRGSRLVAGSGAGEPVESRDEGSDRGESSTNREGDDAQLAVLERYLATASTSACILFVGCPWDARLRVHKALLAAATIADVGRPDPREVPSWIGERVREVGGRIHPEAAARLAELRGNDTMRLQGEIEKLLLHSGLSRPIVAADVDALVGAGEANSAWTLVDAMAEGNVPRAVLTLRRLLDEGEPVPAIVGAIASRLRQMMILRDEATARRPNEAARRLVFPGRSVYFADALARKVARVPPRALTAALASLYDVDRRSKSSSLDDGALIEEWLVRALKTWGFVRS